jgi:tetratricopeptide (TPR) repeat protein
MSKRNIILVVVLVAAVAVLAWVLVPKYSEMARQRELDALRAARDETEAAPRMEKLQSFLEEFPRGKYRGYAHGYIFDTYLSLLNDTSRAVEYARDILASEEALDQKGQLYPDLFSLWVRTDNSDSIVVLAEQALEQPLEDHWLYMGMGYELVEVEMHLDLAVRLCEKSVELAKDDYDRAYCLASLGMARLKAGDSEEAVKDLEEANKLTGDDPDEEILKYLGEAQVTTGRKEDAIETYLVLMETGEYGDIRSELVSLYTETKGSAEGLEADIKARRERRMSPAPEFNLVSLEGQSVSLADYKGKVLLLNFTSPT